jgi:predicted alpha-1,6-mannanase (GH76 family)
MLWFAVAMDRAYSVTGVETQVELMSLWNPDDRTYHIVLY